jgi:hypothetical protein
MSCLTPFTAGGEPAVLCAASGAIAAVAPFAPLKGFEDGAGVPIFACGDARAELGPCMLSRTCRCCRRSASLSTMTPGVAELRAPGVFLSEAGLCLSFNFNCCLGAGVAVDMFNLSFGCAGSSTLALASARRL